jgi:hypothetical protein
MKIIIAIAIMISLLLSSCNSDPSLQQYFVENTENKNFVAIDISSSILNIDKAKLTTEQTEAIKSFDKMTVLAFKLDAKNQAAFETEKAKVAVILKDKKYQELMKFGSGKEGASISFVGTDDVIKEFIIFANKKDAGFALIRVVGEDMNPNNIMTFMSVLKDAKVDLKQLAPLQEMLKK